MHHGSDLLARSNPSIPRTAARSGGRRAHRNGGRGRLRGSRGGGLDSDRALFDERTLEITGPDALTYAEIADQLGRGLGRSVHYTDFGEADFRQLLIELGMEESTLEPECFNTSDCCGRDAPTVCDTFEWLTGRTPQTVADWARANRGTFAEALRGTSPN